MPAIRLDNPADAFNVSDYSAKGDGSTDDTAAIQAAITAAISFATSTAGRGYAMVIFENREYVVSGAMTSRTSAINQITIPYNSGAKYILELVGVGHKSGSGSSDGSKIYEGTVIRSTSTGNTYAGTGQPPAILSCDTSGSNFSNVHLIVRNLCVRAPDNPTMSGIWAEDALCVQVDGVRIDTNVAAASVAQPTSAHAVGLCLPRVSNFAYLSLNDYYCMGFGCGLILGEHTLGTNLYFYRCLVAVAPNIAASYHASHFTRINYEHCPRGISFYDPASGSIAAPGINYAQFVIDVLDIEDATTPAWAVPIAHIRDGGPGMLGKVTFKKTTAGVGNASGLTITGATRLWLHDLNTGGAGFGGTVSGVSPFPIAATGGRLRVNGHAATGAGNNTIEFCPSVNTEFSGFEAYQTDGTTVAAFVGYQQSTNHFRANLAVAGGAGKLMYVGTTRIEWGQTGIGFFATAQAAKQTVTGAKGGNAALASLLTALANYGLVVDSSTA